PLRVKLSRGAILVLLLVPIWKIAGSFWRLGPQPVNPESARLGGVLFTHRWSEQDPLAKGDGLGPVYNATSCEECHSQGGVGGSGAPGRNVTVYGLARRHPKGFPQAGIVHQKAVRPSFQETLNLVHPSLSSQSSIPLAALTDRRGRRSPEVIVGQR